MDFDKKAVANDTQSATTMERATRFARLRSRSPARTRRPKTAPGGFLSLCDASFSNPGPFEKNGDPQQGSPFFGAGNEIRTRYLHLGKVALCQMSYARISNAGAIIAE